VKHSGAVCRVQVVSPISFKPEHKDSPRRYCFQAESIEFVCVCVCVCVCVLHAMIAIILNTHQLNPPTEAAFIQ
jgi:hypothetical protein